LNILVVGSGGREHALAWKIAQSTRVAKVFVAPGNAGTARDATLTNVALNDIADLVSFARREHVALTVVGPEGPLAAGIVDAFARRAQVFGPTQDAAQLELKDFAKRSWSPRHSTRGRAPSPMRAA
jgi:phosphoribosylamine--glycine ligase